ncbi:LTA synthase family protein [Intestinimonas massiliensis (ex Afouda et al. 2020)]|uniref:LTA synthase family protein n=1 Tax=Intestinimonas massiliensis (ex Afouda et al. 2020) TaxID=1673721 RepID=UPI001F5FC1AF|nr:LTA synthase family protein [Intestinimonas massiliensis (ex Afouda et al. 2020)]
MQVKATHSKMIKTGLWQAAFLLLTPLTAAWLMQFTYGALPWSMGPGPALANALCIALLFWPLCALTGRIAPCCIGVHIAAGAWGAANYFVNSFRGTPILPWDLTALRTAADVAGNYRFIPTWQMAAAIILMVALIVFLHKEEHKAPLRLTGKRWPLRLVCLGAGLVCLTFLFPTQRLERFSVETDVWDPAGSYRTGGCLAAFLRNTEFLEVEEPEDPSGAHVAQIMADVEAPEPAEVSVERPNIVAIMNESWADFEYYGNLSLSESVTDYISSLDNAVYGHAYTSVFGAGTSASEFEFLTGNSMAFLPSGSIPYQQYVLGPTASLASRLKAEGYDTLAFHPGECTSWQRDRAYPNLGFDSYKCGEDMDVPQSFEHGYVSDQSDFEQVIWEFEHRQGDAPLFLFNVTIQNHGGYTAADYPAQVTLTDVPGLYPMAEQYLTLANKTDQAFRTLVEYFAQQEEPTIIVMFGDHQPSLEQAFLDKAYGVPQEQMSMGQYMEKYFVPFVIWANYPLPEEGPEITSLNFLGQYLLRYAGIGSTAYGDFLWQLQEQLPALTFVGYLDQSGHAYSHLENNDYTPLIQDYQCVQYNNLFGRDERQAELFDMPITQKKGDLP